MHNIIELNSSVTPTMQEVKENDRDDPPHPQQVGRCSSEKSLLDQETGQTWR